jgi:nucleotide-binding universal stress UspA family protein
MQSSVTEAPDLLTSHARPAFQRILFATDFSRASHAAFQPALDLTRLFGATLTILHVFEYADEVSAPDGVELVQMQDLLHDAEARLYGLQREAAQSGAVCDIQIRRGIAPITIEEFIRAEKIDLTILGTNALHGFERLVFGSTAEAVLRRSPAPVLTVGPRAQPAPISDHQRPIVFATDFHSKTGAPLHCVHVLPRSLEGASNPDVIPHILVEALQHLEASGGVAAEDIKDPICAVTFGSEISNAIIDYARQHNAGLIVLGIRQSSFLAAHLPAHIAYRIITEAQCPVFTMAYPAPRETGALACAAYCQA